MKRIIGIICVILISTIAIGLIAVFILYTIKSIDKSLFIGLISSLLATLLVMIVTYIFRNGISKQLARLFRRKYDYDKKMKDESVRLSYSYLIRIRVNNKYLLIKSNSIKNIYQPVGGVYHIVDDKYIKTKLGFYRDGSPGDSEDIRGVVKGKYIKKFERWFNKKKHIEKAPLREFKEELISTNILDPVLFIDDKLTFQYSGTRYEGVNDNIYYGQYAKYELLRYEIYEFVPNEEQLDYLKKLKNKSIYLATSNEIKTLGVDKDHNTRRFGTQTNKILEDE